MDGEEAELEVAHPHGVGDLEDLLLPRVVGLELAEQRPVLAGVAVRAEHLVRVRVRIRVRVRVKVSAEQRPNPDLTLTLT